MNNELSAILLGLIAAIGWGISGFFDAKASRSVHPLVASLVVNGLLTVVYAVYYFAFTNHGALDFTAAIYTSLGGAIIAIGAMTYFKALALGPIALVSPMSSAYPLITTLVATVLFGGTLRAEQGIAVAMIIAGILVTTEFIYIITRRGAIRIGPLLGLITAVCWGIGYAFVATAVRTMGWQSATLVELIAMMAAFGICIPFLKAKNKVTGTAIAAAMTNKYIIAASLIALTAALSFNIGLSHDETGGAIVATFSAFYPILTVLLALRHFNESIKIRQLAGASISIAGVILLTIL